MPPSTQAVPLRGAEGPREFWQMVLIPPQCHLLYLGGLRNGVLGDNQVSFFMRQSLMGYR